MLKIAWISRIQDESQASWKIIPNQFLHKHGGLAFLTKCNFATSTLHLDDIKLLTFFIIKFPYNARSDWL